MPATDTLLEPIDAIVLMEDETLATAGTPSVNDKIERIEAELLNVPQVDMPLTHRFAPGVYLREIFMPAGTFVIGHQHNTEHFNLVIAGRASVMIEGKVHQIVAPCIFKSGMEVRKVLFIHEDMRWLTVHPTDETNLDRLEEILITKSPSFLLHEGEMKALREGMAEQRELEQSHV